ncbi:MAG TPA: alpha/beta hydrolase [Candidatus Limnocylindria bacterium]|nr:alpha/beta hydrolase [Candidatus Limnocylindria bacterium]
MTVPMAGDFRRRRITVDGVGINTLTAGSGPPVLLLHGYPQTHLVWHHVAPELAAEYTVVLTDLRGYGDSDKPESSPDHATYAKRAMARDQHTVMSTLGFERYGVVGHDRGARVGHRMGLDYPEAVVAFAALDVVPTLHAFTHVDVEFARGYYHWFFLTAGNGIPERLIGADPGFWVRARMGSRHHGGVPIDEAALSEYVRCFSDPEAIRASCEDYRAAATIDLEHDRADADADRSLRCPTLLLWGAHSFVGRHYDVPAAWRRYAPRVHGVALPCDHYVPEEAPAETLEHLVPFLHQHVGGVDGQHGRH